MRAVNFAVAALKGDSADTQKQQAMPRGQEAMPKEQPAGGGRCPSRSGGVRGGVCGVHDSGTWVHLGGRSLCHGVEARLQAAADPASPAALSAGEAPLSCDAPAVLQKGRRC